LVCLVWADKVLRWLNSLDLTSFFYLFSDFPLLYISVFIQNVYGTEWPLCIDVPLRNYPLSLFFLYRWWLW